jgi:uncharacterized protein
MSVFFFDSSALTKRYLQETGSTWVATLTDLDAGHFIVVAEITRVEVAAALAARHRAGTITLPERDDLVNLVLRLLGRLGYACYAESTAHVARPPGHLRSPLPY